MILGWGAKIKVVLDRAPPRFPIHPRGAYSIPSCSHPVKQTFGAAIAAKFEAVAIEHEFAELGQDGHGAGASPIFLTRAW